MRIVYDLNELTEPLMNPVLTIGNFDGVHRGHLALFDKVIERAKAINGQSVVMTFDPHPIKVMSPGNGPPLITPIEQKLELISNAGVDVILCIAFTPEFASMSAKDFVQSILMDRLGVKEIVVGYDYTFGHMRQGDVSFLRKMGDKLGFRLHVTGPIHLDDTIVSSTSIREFVQQGNLVDAKRFLGRDYQISGAVVKGKGRGGRLLGYPTANLKPVDELIPRRGVYAVTVRVDDKNYCGVANIGYNPTFGDDTLSVETHLLDFSENIVGRKIKIRFIQRLRDEMTFGDAKELSDRISQDIEQARKLTQILSED
jgi:riboflavin kinase/FMN adenylyltransferase